VLILVNDSVIVPEGGDIVKDEAREGFSTFCEQGELAMMILYRVPEASEKLDLFVFSRNYFAVVKIDESVLVLVSRLDVYNATHGIDGEPIVLKRNDFFSGGVE